MTSVELVSGIDVRRWLAFTTTEAALSLAPGPAVLMVVGVSIARGARTALAAAAGILAANALYFALSALGVGSAIAASPALFTAIKFAGAAWLAWIGLSALFARVTPLSIDPLRKPTGRSLRVFGAGLTMQLGNPKSLLFFVAILPGFIVQTAPIAPQMLLYAASSVIPELAILAGYAWLAARARRLIGDVRYQRRTERVAGVLLLTVAVFIAFRFHA